MRIFDMKPIYNLRRGSVKVRSRHKILKQLGQDILEGLSVNDIAELGDMMVLVGCHHNFGLFPLGSSFCVGIQTEQFLDQNGRELWGMVKKPKGIADLMKNLSRVDVMLDTNISNRSWWEEQDLSPKDRAKLYFGPRIFPSEPRAFRSVPGGPNLFFGSMDGRRGSVIEQLGGVNVKVLPRGTYGTKLENELNAAGTVINIHFDEGIYTEAPRLLTAYLAGKPIKSEMLGDPFVKGVHYIEIEGCITENAQVIYDAFSQLVTEELSFASFIRSAFAETNQMSRTLS